MLQNVPRASAPFRSWVIAVSPYVRHPSCCLMSLAALTFRTFEAASNRWIPHGSHLRRAWNMLLFASKNTLDLLRVFILEPTGNNLAKCAISRRVDLGRQPVDLETLDLNLKRKNS